MGDLFDDPPSAATDLKPGVRLTYDDQSNWRCDHCGKAFMEKPERRLRLSARFDDPLFDRAIDLCPPCSRLVVRKMYLIMDLLEPESRKEKK